MILKKIRLNFETWHGIESLKKWNVSQKNICLKVDMIKKVQFNIEKNWMVCFKSDRISKAKKKLNDFQ
jgi:hypothetical protein